MSCIYNARTTSLQRFLPLHPERKLLTGCRHVEQGAIWFHGDSMTKVCYTCWELIEERWSEVRALTAYEVGVPSRCMPASRFVLLMNPGA